MVIQDPLSKMGKTKITGQEMLMYYRKNQKKSFTVQKTQWSRVMTIELALDLGGNQTLAVKEIENDEEGVI